MRSRPGTLFGTLVAAFLMALCAATPGGTAQIHFEGLAYDSYPIPTGYGSTPEVAVSYATLAGPENDTVVENQLRFWNDSYSGRPAAFAWDPYGKVGQVTLDAEPGFTVTLESFFLGAWPNYTRTSRWYVYSLDWTLLASSGGDVAVPGTGGLTVNPGLTSLEGDGFHIQFGPDSWNVGVNDISFTAEAAAVPEPSTLLLLGTGTFALATRVRRRKPPLDRRGAKRR